MEPESPDSPWPQKALASYESILPGTYWSFKGMRFFMNLKLPKIKNADVIILNGYMGILFQWLLRITSKSIPCIFWGERMATQPHGLKSKIHRVVTNPLSKCKAIVAIGTRAQNEYQLRFAPVPVFSIPYYCNLQSFQSLPLKHHQGKMNLLFCGQMIYRKGVDVLLKAFEQLAIEHDVVLHLVGREAELQEMLAPLNENVKSKIIYHGFQAPEKLPEYFALADVFILPSRYDGWGVVVNQAIGAGLPVICSDQVGAGLDLIKEGENGFRFKTGDSADLYSKLKNLVENPELIHSFSANSRAKSFDLLPEKGAEKWVEVLSSLRRSVSIENAREQL